MEAPAREVMGSVGQIHACLRIGQTRCRHHAAWLPPDNGRRRADQQKTVLSVRAQTPFSEKGSCEGYAETSLSFGAARRVRAMP